MSEGAIKHIPIEREPVDMKALHELLNELYGEEDPKVIAAAASLLQKMDQREPVATAEFMEAMRRARRVREEGVPDGLHTMDSNLNVMGRDTRPEDERMAA